MRRIRWADLLLIAAIVPLGVWAWQTARERSRLEAAHVRLRERLGYFDVPDRTKFAFRAIPTGSPTEFAWRAYFPAGPWSGTGLSMQGGGGGGGNSGQAEGSEGICRIRFLDRPDGNIEFAVSAPDGSGGNILLSENQSLYQFLRGHWDQLQVEQAGGDATVVAGSDQPLVLLRLSLSPALWAEYQAHPPAATRLLPTPEFYRYTLNPKPNP